MAKPIKHIIYYLSPISQPYFYYNFYYKLLIC
nr:MAG TPA: hypothetical protein [Caudoviricetes sp.]